MPKQNNLSGPDIVTGAFSVKRVSKPPRSVADALADLEVQRREGTTPLLVMGDVIAMYADDFLGGGEVIGG